ncbi:MAG: transposase [Candidatus Hydrogenedentes bacterium]|nr:transposase [Candidatus Hydrogenedentota bacterium]
MIYPGYPRAFDVVCGDALYMDPSLWKLARRYGKHVIAVLKNENRDLMVDARSLFEPIAPLPLRRNNTQCRCWDLPGFDTWPQCGESVRVVRAVEESVVRRQRSKTNETSVSEWFWVSSLPPEKASTALIVRAGHGRWGIENQGFNELSNQWHGDHGYKYDAHALLAATLLLFIAYNLFHAFVTRNLKPEIRSGRTDKYWADLIAAEVVATFHPYPAPT